MFSMVRRSLCQSIARVRGMHGLRYEKITEKDYDRCLDHLRRVSYFDMPLYAAANLVGSGKPTTDLDRVYLDSMKEGFSHMAFVDDKFAGVLINGILTPDAVPGAIEAMKKSTNLDYQRMDYMFLQLLLDMDIFERFGINKAMECRILSTEREYRGTGLGKILVDKLTDCARELDIPLIVGEAVNDYLWRLLVSEGWVMVREMPYTDYTNEANGEVIFKVKPPHDILGVCVRIVDGKCKSKDPLPLPRKKIVFPIKFD